MSTKILIKPNLAQYLSNIFKEISIFTLMKFTKKKESEATLGTLGKEKLKFIKKTQTAKQ